MLKTAKEIIIDDEKLYSGLEVGFGFLSALCGPECDKVGIPERYTDARR